MARGSAGEGVPEVIECFPRGGWVGSTGCRSELRKPAPCSVAPSPGTEQLAARKKLEAQIEATASSIRSQGR